MVHLTQTASRQRSERRIAVRLPLRVRGRDSRGVVFEEETSSENLCRSGAAFVTRFDVAIGRYRLPRSMLEEALRCFCVLSHVPGFKPVRVNRRHDVPKQYAELCGDVP